MDCSVLLISLPGILIVILAVFHMRELTSNRNLNIRSRILQSHSCSEISCSPPENSTHYDPIPVAALQ
jgi:hypothetical protein